MVFEIDCVGHWRAGLESAETSACARGLLWPPDVSFTSPQVPSPCTDRRRREVSHSDNTYWHVEFTVDFDDRWGNRGITNCTSDGMGRIT